MMHTRCMGTFTRPCDDNRFTAQGWPADTLVDDGEEKLVCVGAGRAFDVLTHAASGGSALGKGYTAVLGGDVG